MGREANIDSLWRAPRFRGVRRHLSILRRTAQHPGIEIVFGLSFGKFNVNLKLANERMRRDPEHVLVVSPCSQPRAHQTPQEVRDEVKRRIDDFAPGGGFIFNTVHNIQADVPPENILAMWEALREYGVYDAGGEKILPFRGTRLA